MSALDSLTRVAEISLTVAQRAGSLALSAVRQVAGMAFDHGSESRSSTTAPPPPAAAAAPAPPAPARAAPVDEAAPVPTPAAAAEPAVEEAPAHVDREAVLVAESADAGAADGAGAQIRIAEPWSGYGKLTAREVNDRLATESPESLAVARLYEAMHRNRVTVLKEIDRRLATAGR
jgi:type IV secretory pathway VirB10-like protein